MRIIDSFGSHEVPHLGSVFVTGIVPSSQNFRQDMVFDANNFVDVVDRLRVERGLQPPLLRGELAARIVCESELSADDVAEHHPIYFVVGPERRLDPETALGFVALAPRVKGLPRAPFHIAEGAFATWAYSNLALYTGGLAALVGAVGSYGLKQGYSRRSPVSIGSLDPSANGHQAMARLGLHWDGATRLFIGATLEDIRQAAGMVLKA